MPNYERLHAVDELPAREQHWKQERVEKRALIVARHKGKWVKYAHYSKRPTAISQATKIRNRPEFAALGRVETAVRPHPDQPKFVIYVRFADLDVSDRDLADRIKVAGGDDALDAIEHEDTDSLT
jgi:hypothetical protein